MNTKTLSLAVFTMISMASFSSTYAADPADHYAVQEMKACKGSNNDCLKFKDEVGRKACQSTSANSCAEGCKALMKRYGGDENWCN